MNKIKTVTEMPYLRVNELGKRFINEEMANNHTAIMPGGYDTLGGLAIDENANVLDDNNYPIQGLYAAGDMVAGSLYGNPPSNAGGTVYGSMPIGMLAGDSAAAFVRGV